MSAVSVQVLDEQAAKRAGLNGLVLRVSRADGKATPAAFDVSAPTQVLAGEAGGDFGARGRWLTAPDCQATACRNAKPAPAPKTTARTQSAAPGSTQAATGTVSGTPMLMAFTTAAAATAAASGTNAANGSGSFAATSLSPSSQWQVSAQTGSFTWDYPLRTPPAAAGPSPDLALSYDSGSVDGQTASTNNQPGPVGDGWSLAGAGYIERSYVPCSEDGQTGSGDLCWRSDNATVSFAGHSGQLVKDATTGTWHLLSDDNTKIEHLTAAGINGDNDGEYWRLTTTDGTQYYFGRNHLPGWTTGLPETQSAWTVPVFGNGNGEPCHAATFATSACTQAWRWNLDYVVDPEGNSEAFYYTPDANYYSQNGTSVVAYTRGGWLARIDYGMHSGFELTAAAPQQILLTGADRCIPGSVCDSAHPQSWPDVPWDLNCTAASCAITSPSFWTTKRLDTITTQYRTSSGAYVAVDSWTLHQSYPDPSDGTSPALWLASISHSGLVGSTITIPDVTFSGLALQNRSSTASGLTKLSRYRVNAVTTEAGGSIAISYLAAECTSANLPALAETNTMRCFPQWWTPPGGSPMLDWFNKYPVAATSADGVTGDAGATATPLEQTRYDYSLGHPAWRYDASSMVPDDKRTWSVWAGYSKVRVIRGSPVNPAAQEAADYTFFQGLDGDRATPAGGTKTVSLTASNGTVVTDSPWWSGQIFEETTHLGMVDAATAGAVLSRTVTIPWASAGTATDGIRTARHTGIADTTTLNPLSTGATLTTEIRNSFDTYGRVTQVDDLGDVTTATDDRCTLTSYADNTTLNLLDLDSRTTVLAKSCTATANYQTDVISDSRTFYDGATTFAGQTPTLGALTQTQDASGYAGTTGDTATWLTTSTNLSYDAIGRLTSSTDGIGRTTTTSYTPTATAPLGSNVTATTQIDVTDANGWHSVTSYDPAWSAPTAQVDPNGRTTTATYDALGRRTQVWLPGRPQANNPTPSISYSYTMSLTAPSSVATTTLTPNGGTATSYTLHDGLGRLRQTQDPAEAQSVSNEQAPAGSQGTIVADTIYDTAGRVVVSNPHYLMTPAPSGSLLVPNNGEGNIDTQNQTTYDGAGRPNATIYLKSGVEQWRTTIGYPGIDRTDTTPPTGGTATTAIRDARGNTVSVLQYHGPTPTGAADTTAYTYDVAGRMRTMTESSPAHHQWIWAYNSLSQLTSSTDPDTGTTTRSYDGAGRLRTTTDSRNISLTYSYDNLDRTTALYSGTTTSGTQLAGWVYDTLPGGKGMLTSATRYANGTTYTKSVTGYDAAGRPTGSSISLPAIESAAAATYTTSFAYKVEGSLASAAEPAIAGLPAETVNYTYTTLGNLMRLVGRSSYLSSMQYNALGMLAQAGSTYGVNGLYRTYTLDVGSGRLINSQTSTAATANPIAANRNYTYNNAGDITQVTDTPSTGGADTQCFTYDYLRRLTRAFTPAGGSCAATPTDATLGGPAPYWQDYTYDALGNRASITRHDTTGAGSDLRDTYTYPTSGFGTAGTGGPHAVASITHASTPAGGSTWSTTGTDTYAYTAAGQTTATPGRTMTWDVEGRLASATAAGQTQTDVYDADGNLLVRADPTSGSTVFVGDTELHYAPGASSASAARTFTGAGMAVAVRTVAAGSNVSTLTWLATDGQNTALVAENATTAAMSVRRQDPFGNPRGVPGLWPDPDRGFLHAPTDPGTGPFTGTTHLGAREYVAGLGRFLSVDPVLDTGDLQQIDGYGYADNDPVNQLDPSGLRSKCEEEGTCGSAAHKSGARAPATLGGSHDTSGHNTNPAMPSDYNYGGHGHGGDMQDVRDERRHNDVVAMVAKEAVAKLRKALAKPSVLAQAWKHRAAIAQVATLGACVVASAGACAAVAVAGAIVSNVSSHGLNVKGTVVDTAIALVPGGRGARVASAEAKIASHAAAEETATAARATLARRPTIATRASADEAATDANGVIRCQYCNEPVELRGGSPLSREYDHEVPYSQGGGRGPDNIVVSCRTCNRQKGARTPEEWGGP